MGKWVFVRRYASASTPGRWYTVKLDVTRQALGCDCPAWRFNRERTCKHTRRAEAEVLEAAGGPPARLRRAWLPDAA